MEKIFLKNSDLQVSRICFGGCPMGGHGWGDVSKQALLTAVNKALDLDVNFFDSADVYGFGEGETLLGKAIGKRRNQAVIATKFGVRVENGKTFYDNSPKWIKASIQNSLKRLNTDYIDLYQVHYRDGITPISEVIHTLDELKKNGLIRYYGLSNINKNDIPELNEHVGKFVSFQDEYSLACRKNENDIIEVSSKLELTPLTWGSLGQGILTGKYDINTKFDSNDRRSREIYVNFHGDKLKQNLATVEEIKKISLVNGKSISSIAIRFILDYIKKSVVIVGIKDQAQLASNLEALGWTLTEKQINELVLAT